MARRSGVPRSGARRRLFALSLALTAAGTVAAACGGGSSGSAPTKAASGDYTFTVLESTPGFFDLPLRAAIDDFAPKNHLKLKIVTVTGGGGLATEFEGGTGSVAMVAVDTPMRLQQQKGVPGGVTIIGTNMTNMLYALVAKTGSKYHSLTDLKGATVADTGAGSSSQVVLSWALLTQAHLQLSDVHITPLGAPPTILAGVQKGSVAAGTVFSPALDQGLADKSVQMVYDFRDNHYAQNVFMARTSEVQKDSKPYQLFMQSYNQAVQKLQSDPSYATAEAQKYWGQGADAATLQAELDFYRTKEWKDTTFPQSLYDASKQVLLNSGSGFSSQNFPSYEDVTKNAPKLG